MKEIVSCGDTDGRTDGCGEGFIDGMKDIVGQADGCGDTDGGAESLYDNTFTSANDRAPVPLSFTITVLPLVPPANSNSNFSTPVLSSMYLLTTSLLFLSRIITSLLDNFSVQQSIRFHTMILLISISNVNSTFHHASSITHVCVTEVMSLVYMLVLYLV